MVMTQLTYGYVHVLLWLQFLVSSFEAYSMPLNRSSFPDSFLFGAGISSYQSEGAAKEDGRTPSIWDTFVREHPEKIADGSTGEVADAFYHRYKDDIKVMKTIGFGSFKFSISWSRVLPSGRVSGGVNQVGVQFYNNLINELLANGLQPFVTLYHWDLPQTLEDLYGGWLSPNITKDFEEYADFCFKTFGDRVKHWITINEPNGASISGYDAGFMAPGRCSNYVGICSQGNSATEPYIAAHHFLLAHATAVKLYRSKYQHIQKGEIGIVIVTLWFVPKFKTNGTREATSRAIDFMFGWIAHPVTYGDYPESMRSIVGNRLPKFTQEESNMLKGSFDFIGVNYYSSSYVENDLLSNTANHSFSSDTHTKLTGDKNGTPIGTPTSLPWLYSYPKGIMDLMLYIKKNYQNPPIYITENGMADNASLPLNVALKDATRLRYHQDHLSWLLKAIKKGVNVKGYYLWSFMDDFEWNGGYTVRFGVIYIDYKNNVKRYLKDSAYWFKMFLLN